MLFELLSNLKLLILNVAVQNSFAKPLSSEEEAALLDLLSKGDEKARSKLIEHNLRLVAHIVKKYYSISGDTDDLISIGTIGLIKGVNSFDPVKGARLSSYCSRCIENEILMHFRSGKKSQHDISLNEPIDTDKDGNALTLIDVIAQDDTIIDDIDIKIKTEKLQEYIKKGLKSRERKIIEMRYGLSGSDPLTQREIAKKLGISRSYVSRIEKSALNKLHEMYE